MPLFAVWKNLKKKKVVSFAVELSIYSTTIHFVQRLFFAAVEMNASAYVDQMS